MILEDVIMKRVRLVLALVLVLSLVFVAVVMQPASRSNGPADHAQTLAALMHPMDFDIGAAPPECPAPDSPGCGGG